MIIKIGATKPEINDVNPMMTASGERCEQAVDYGKGHSHGRRRGTRESNVQEYLVVQSD
jgi:hypothetical protein